MKAKTKQRLRLAVKHWARLSMLFINPPSITSGHASWQQQALGAFICRGHIDWFGSHGVCLFA